MIVANLLHKRHTTEERPKRAQLVGGTSTESAAKRPPQLIPAASTEASHQCSSGADGESPARMGNLWLTIGTMEPNSGNAPP